MGRYRWADGIVAMSIMFKPNRVCAVGVQPVSGVGSGECAPEPSGQGPFICLDKLRPFMACNFSAFKRTKHNAKDPS